MHKSNFISTRKNPASNSQESNSPVRLRFFLKLLKCSTETSRGKKSFLYLHLKTLQKI